MAIYKGWPNRSTYECYDYLELTGDIYNKYVGFVTNLDYGVYQLAKQIREDIESIISEAIQLTDNELIANLLYSTSYDINYVELATLIFREAKYITNDVSALNEAFEQELNLKGEQNK